MKKSISILLGVLISGGIIIGGYKAYAQIKEEWHKAQYRNNDHGLEMIDYNKVQEKIADGERFIIFIGRDTCPHCQLIDPLIEEIKDYVKETPFYYLNCYQYRENIKDGKEGAQEEWDNIKAFFGIEYIPSVLYYEEGKVKDAYLDFVGEDYFDVGEEEQAKRFQEASGRLQEWFENNGLVE